MDHLLGIVGSEAKGMTLALKDPTVQLWRDSAIEKSRKTIAPDGRQMKTFLKTSLGQGCWGQVLKTDKVGKQIANTMNDSHRKWDMTATGNLILSAGKNK